MISGTTPFKIHDENAGAMGMKSSLKVGGNANAKKKKVLMTDGIMSTSKTPILSKSSRKALGAISVNKQLGHEDALQEDNKSRLLAPMSSKKASTSIPDVSSMICSQVTKDEDVFDMTMKEASELKTVLVPSISIDRPMQVVQGESGEHSGTCFGEEVNVDCAALSLGTEDGGAYTFTLGPSEEDW